MKKLIFLISFLYSLSGYCQKLSVLLYRDSTGEVKMSVKGDKHLIVTDSNYTVNEALRDCDSVNQIEIKALKKQIAALKKQLKR